MGNCDNCGKKFGFLGPAIAPNLGIAKGKGFCSIKCYREFSKKKKVETEGKVMEFKCKCNQCGKIWHYLPKEISDLRTQQIGNAMIGASMCCNPFGALFSNKAIESRRQIEKFNKCPECGSSDIKKEEVWYEKK